MKTVTFRHVCSVEDLLKIITEQRFRPIYPSALAGDSGINGYIEGDAFIRTQDIEGEGAELVIEWCGDVINDLGSKLKYPLQPNVLIRQGAWRSVIPFGTEKSFIKVVDFELDSDERTSLFQKLKLWLLKRKLRTCPVFLTLRA